MRIPVLVFELRPTNVTPNRVQTQKVLAGEGWLISASDTNAIIEWPDGSISAVSHEMIQLDQQADRRLRRQVQVQKYARKDNTWVRDAENKAVKENDFVGFFQGFFSEVDTDGELHPVMVVEDQFGEVNTYGLDLVRFII